MRYQRIARIAKEAIDKRGGVEALKQDMQGVAEAAKGKGSLKEKAKAAAEALKQPGSATHPDAPVTPGPGAPTATPAPAAPTATPTATPPHDSPIAPPPGPAADAD
jgi:hypothetical protein